MKKMFIWNHGEKISATLFMCFTHVIHQTSKHLLSQQTVNVVKEIVKIEF